MGSCCYNYLKDGGKSGGGWRLDSSALLLRWKEKWRRMEAGEFSTPLEVEGRVVEDGDWIVQHSS